MKYVIDDFVADMRELVAAQPSRPILFERGATYLERLIASASAIPEHLQVPNRPGMTLYRVHDSPGLTVNTVVWEPGFTSSIHDHGTWGMVGLVSSSIEETRYVRVDDRSTEIARLEDRGVGRLVTGEVSLIRPDVADIHRMHNATGRPTVEVHVYGLNLSAYGFNVYDGETGAVRWIVPAPSPASIPA